MLQQNCPKCGKYPGFSSVTTSYTLADSNNVLEMKEVTYSKLVTCSCGCKYPCNSLEKITYSYEEINGDLYVIKKMYTV